jgi:hypothetical protein
MKNALVNRIKQRLEAHRDFMRSVFASHHALIWRMTDAPGLRALGLTPKKTEPSRTRVVQTPRAASVKPRNAKALEIPDLDSEVVETPQSLEHTEPTIEANTEYSSMEVSAEIEPLEQTELATQEPTKLEPQRALEILERRESLATPESVGVAPKNRSGETTPPDVSPRASIENVVNEGVVVPGVEVEEVKNLIESNLEEDRAFQPTESLIEAESLQSDAPQIIQEANNPIVEQQKNLIEPEKTQELQPAPKKPLDAARASEILQQRAALETEQTTSVPEIQKSDLATKPQLEKPVSTPQARQERQKLEPGIQATPENQESKSEPQTKPELVAREAQEVSQVSSEIPTFAEVPALSVEAKSEISTPTMRTSEPVIEETRDSEIPSSEVASQEAIPESETLNAEKTLPETVAQEPQQELVAREPQQELVAQVPQQESDSQQEPVTRDIPKESKALETSPEFEAREMVQEPETRETRTEPQAESVSSHPSTPEQTNWQRSIPGDPQSGVVEIIRAKPPRISRPERSEKPVEARDEPATSQTPDARVSESSEATTQPKQTLAERMQSLQNRFGENQETRFDPRTNSFAQKTETASDEAPAPKFQSISDVAQRLARHYSETPTQTSSEQDSIPPDLKVGQQLGQTQTRAANEFVQQGTQPVQLRESTRTFLAPLIGFDPSLARVFVGPQASEFTSSLNADGATVGTDVYLNNGFDEQVPEGLGLLAHELTHVGQNLQPDFVPPMLQSADQPDFANESFETQARVVEARVTNTAMFVPAMSLETPGMQQTSTTPIAANTAQRNADAWDGLPAPWEAMPNLNTSDFVTVVNPNTSGSSSSTSTGFAPVSDSSSSGVQLAEADRPADNPDNVPHGAAGGQPQPPAQDMDLLAQQVYEILKRRLSSERRREG